MSATVAAQHATDEFTMSESSRYKKYLRNVSEGGGKRETEIGRRFQIASFVYQKAKCIIKKQENFVRNSKKER